MQYISVQISLVALLPTLLLCWYIYEKDRVEKEPKGLLGLLFLVGGIGFIPAYFAERGIAGLIDGWFASRLSFSAEGALLFDNAGVAFAHTALFAFCGVALVENSIKWLLLVLITRKSRHFNCLFDGLIYASFVSLGFAAFESVAYAWQNGWDTLWLRLATAIPCHLLIGVLMGYGYTLWHTFDSAQKAERRLVQDGTVSAANIRGAGGFLTAGFVVPLLTQGLYVTVGSFYSALVSTLFYVAVGILFVLCFVGIHLLSDKDNPTEKTSLILLLRKHPDTDITLLREAINAEVSYGK